MKENPIHVSVTPSQLMRIAILRQHIIAHMALLEAPFEEASRSDSARMDELERVLHTAEHDLRRILAEPSVTP